MRHATPISLIVSLAAVLVVLGLACSENTSQPGGGDDGGSGGDTGDPLSAACMSCHGDEERLQATASPDTSSGEEPSGEG
jgi:hypothetical protein